MASREQIRWTFVEFNRKRSVEEILNLEFNGNVSECARSMDMSPVYLHGLIYDTSRNAGKINLTKILRYCLQTGKDPLRYITKVIK